MKRQIISSALALSLVLGGAATSAPSFIPALQTAITASAVESYGDLYYESDGKTITITGYKPAYDGGSKYLSIPKKIDGLPVTGIGANAFRGHPYNDPDIESLYIPEGVTTIGDCAFCDAENLTTVNIPSTVKSIGVNCFSNTAITSIKIPNSITDIPSAVFSRCYNLTSIEIPDKVTNIPSYAFFGCTNLTKVKFGNKVTVIGEGAFTNCSSLYDITPLPNSLKSIGEEAFMGCTSISRFDIPVDVITIGDKAFGYEYDTKMIKNFSLGIWNDMVSETYANDKEIKKVYLSKSISKATVTLSSNSYEYNGKSKTPTVKVKLGKKTLKKGTDYTVTYKNNTRVGTATVTIKGRRLYKGTIKKTFKIVPKKTTIKKVTSPKTKQLKVTYKKNANATGYQITYSTSKKFTKKTTKNTTVKSAATLNKTIKKLKKGKTYYVKVRAYKTVGSTKYYGAYSAVKKVKVK